MNWLDWIIAVVLAASALGGLRHGLVNSVAKLAATLAGLFVAFKYYRPLADYLSLRWNMEEVLLPLVEEFFKLWLPAGVTLPPALTQGNPTSAGAFAAKQLAAYSEQLARTFASGMLDAISFLALFLVTASVIGLAGVILNGVARFSLLGPLNHLGGLFFGAVRGLILVMMIISLLAPFQRPDLLPGVSSTRGKAFQDSTLLPYLRPLFDAVGRPLPEPSGNGHVDDGPVLTL